MFSPFSNYILSVYLRWMMSVRYKICSILMSSPNNPVPLSQMMISLVKIQKPLFLLYHKKPKLRCIQNTFPLQFNQWLRTYDLSLSFYFLNITINTAYANYVIIGKKMHSYILTSTPSSKTHFQWVRKIAEIYNIKPMQNAQIKIKITPQMWIRSKYYLLWFVAHL